MSVVDVDAAETHEDGAWIRVRGPFGISRVARTKIVRESAPSHDEAGLLEGRADVQTGTSATVVWSLARSSAGTTVSLEVTIHCATLLDRVLIALGGLYWLKVRVLRRAISDLDRELAVQRR